MAHIHSQVRQAGRHVGSLLLPFPQPRYGKCVSKRMETGAAAAISSSQAEFANQLTKAAAQRGKVQLPALLGYEENVRESVIVQITSPLGILAHLCRSRIVQRNKS